MNELDDECRRSVRYDRPFSVILSDIDNFKEINDTYGHLKGDEVLKGIAGILIDKLRTTDIAGRWGGEEFLILCPETGLDGAVDLVRKICSLISSCQYGSDVKVTISAG